jgi:hypothetical protein
MLRAFCHSHRSTLLLVLAIKMESSTPTSSGIKSSTPKSSGKSKETPEAKKRRSSLFKVTNKSLAATLFNGVNECCNYHFSSDTKVPALMSRIRLTHLDYDDSTLPPVDRLFNQIGFWYLTGYTYHALVQDRLEILAIVTETKLTEAEAQEGDVSDRVTKFFEDRGVSTTIAEALVAMALNPTLASTTKSEDAIAILALMDTELPVLWDEFATNDMDTQVWLRRAGIPIIDMFKAQKETPLLTPCKDGSQVRNDV